MEGVGGASQAAGGVAIAIGGPDNSGSAPVVSAKAFWKAAIETLMLVELCGPTMFGRD